MRSFVDNGFFDSREAVEDYGTGAAFDVVDGGLGEREADGNGDGVTEDGAEGVGHSA